ncbi:Triple Functional Domain Protein [Manis pentadactyla]|nr:Triple Functional Domain Protein [Manis pentadactyla]
MHHGGGRGHGVLRKALQAQDPSGSPRWRAPWAARSALCAGRRVCRFNSSLPARGAGPFPGGAEASGAQPAGRPSAEPAPARAASPAGGGGAGRGAAGARAAGRRGARGAGRGPRSPAGPGRERPPREAQPRSGACLPHRQPPGARGLASRGRRRERNGGCEARASGPAPSPRSCRLPSSARRRSASRARAADPRRAGRDRDPRALAPPPGARRSPDLPDRGPRGRAARTFAAAPDAARAGARTWWGPAGASRAAGLNCTRRIRGCAEPGERRAWAEGTPALPEPPTLAHALGPATRHLGRPATGSPEASRPAPASPSLVPGGVGGELCCPLPRSAGAPPPPTAQMSLLAARRTSPRPRAEGSRERSPP